MKRQPEGTPAGTAASLTRRDVVRGALAAGALAAGAAGARPVGAGPGPGAPDRTGDKAPAAGRRPHVAVIGAGAFGGWTALWLLRRGARVTLVDAWGPGSSRASSGGDSRVIRGMYGPDEVYTGWVVRSFELWREAERRWGLDLYHPTGSLWLFRGDDGYARASLPILEAAGLPARRLELAEARRRFPQVDFEGVRSVYVEDEAGYLTARRACQAVARAVADEGGELVRAAAQPPGAAAMEGGRLRKLALAGGGSLEADRFVFACGPWLGELFPEVVGRRILPTRQDVFYFGPPAGDDRFSEGSCPVWVDFGERIFYGIPGNEHRGFKVADDTHGDPVDPTSLERTPTPENLERARRILRERFPALAEAPLVETRVCQYENTPDGHYLIDRHPEAEDVWLVGGGSGHGFKLCPALGEKVAAWVLGDGEPLERFALSRLDRLEDAPEGGRSQLESGEGA